MKELQTKQIVLNYKILQTIHINIFYNLEKNVSRKVAKLAQSIQKLE